MHGLTNIMRREAQRAMSQVAQKRMGIVTGYDPDHYAVKVRIQPEDVSTGWIPLAAQAVGNGWGIYAPPSMGDVIEVDFLEGDKESGIAGARFFSASVKPLSVPSGEFWLVNASGACLKFHNDGAVQLNAATALNVVAPVVNVTGSLFVTGDITDNSTTTNETIATMRSRYNSHVHGGVQTGGGTTATTIQTM